jgi:hypothetical protein
MPFDIVQDVVVTAVALTAALLVFRRVFATVRPGGAEPPCASCPSAKAHGRIPQASPVVKPMTFVRGDHASS